MYVAEQDETAVLEQTAHGRAAGYVIRYNVRLGLARVLDLTDPAIASEWGYTATTNTTAYGASQAVAVRAAAAGYDVIKYQSVGANYALLSNFAQLLVPQGVSPAQP
jgi:RES domain-containing protein